MDVRLDVAARADLDAAGAGVGVPAAGAVIDLLLFGLVRRLERPALRGLVANPNLAERPPAAHAVDEEARLLGDLLDAVPAPTVSRMRTFDMSS